MNKESRQPRNVMFGIGAVIFAAMIIYRSVIATRCLPSHTPNWTDTNDGDPGITVIRLFGFIAKNLLYRGNQLYREICSYWKRLEQYR